ncbi:MAG: hypothetical protein KC912_24950 [Proteobacteria bacterium]|nr:hypothetical protein [Pseudomonadota bacterium]
MHIVKLAIVGSALSVLLACEQTTNLSVDIVIPVSVQEGITEYPVRVGFSTAMHTGRTIALCEAKTEDVVFTLEDTASSCVTAPLDVDVLMGPYVPPSTGCVEEAAGAYSVLADGEIIASGSGVAFEDASETTCISQDGTVEITVELGS